MAAKKLKTTKFARKPFYVDAVRVSEENIELVAEWCGGEIKTDEEGAKYILVKVHRPATDRQKMAYLGDWVLYAGSGYKVYVPKAFDKSFEKVRTLTKAQADEAGIRPPIENPKPAKKAAKKAPAKKGPVPTDPKKRRDSRLPIPNPVISREQAEALKQGEPVQAGEGVNLDEDYRDAKTGRFVTEEYAGEHPDTTVKETEKEKSATQAAEELIEELNKG